MTKKALITLGRPGVQAAVITRRPQGYFITHVEGTHPVVNGNPRHIKCRSDTETRQRRTGCNVLSNRHTPG